MYDYSEVPAIRSEEDIDWMAEGRCREIGMPDMWFSNGNNFKWVKRVCESCEVREKCLQFALEHNEQFGVWGGLDTRERNRLKKRWAKKSKVKQSHTKIPAHQKAS